LREVEAPGAVTAPTSAARGPRGRRRGGMTPEGRKRLSEALKARWAAKRGGSSAASAKAKRKGGITAAGRKKLSEALKARWVAKRASASAAPAKKAARKKAA